MLAQLPYDIDALKAWLAEQVARTTRLEEDNVRLNAKVLSLQEQLNLALARRYAASSEKLSPDQIRLFNEAEVDAIPEGDEIAEAGPDETVAVPAHNRKKRGRKPSSLPLKFTFSQATGDTFLPVVGYSDLRWPGSTPAPPPRSMRAMSSCRTSGG